VVEQQERVGERQVDAGERPPNREALALQMVSGGDDARDATPRRLPLREPGQARQGQRICGLRQASCPPRSGYDLMN
jgi:hypothetical protein